MSGFQLQAVIVSCAWWIDDLFASRLSFTNLSLSDSGVYVCVAVNRAGNISSSFTLTVAGSCTYFWLSTVYTRHYAYMSPQSVSTGRPSTVPSCESKRWQSCVTVTLHSHSSDHCRGHCVLQHRPLLHNSNKYGQIFIILLQRIVVWSSPTVLIVHTY